MNPWDSTDVPIRHALSSIILLQGGAGWGRSKILGMGQGKGQTLPGQGKKTVNQ